MAAPKAPDAATLQASLDYLLLLISKSDFKPDFHATAEAANMTSANNAYATHHLTITIRANLHLVKRNTRRSWSRVVNTNL
jgi:hypothetical protein